MNIYPAIDLYNGAVVRLYKGDYSQMTIYDDNPINTAKAFESKGANFLHIVDLEGAKTGTTSNLEVIKNIVQKTNLFIELGGGIRDMETVEKYLSIGVNRIIVGTAAIINKNFLIEALKKYKEKIAVGVDIKDEKVAIKGWTELSAYSCTEFCSEMQKLGVKTIICTDVSKDGAMNGTNLDLYSSLSQNYSLDIIASGGVSTLDDIKTLSNMNINGAILGKALYTGAIDLTSAIKITQE